MTARHVLLTCLAVVVLGVPPSAAASAAPATTVPALAAATSRTTVTTGLQGAAQVTVYDPGDRLGRSGDTHELAILFNGSGAGYVSLTSYDCGPHDVAKTPDELGCPRAGEPHGSFEVTGPPATVDGDTIRWRSTTSDGPLVLTLSGGTYHRWLHREWRNAEGTGRESGREVLSRYTGPSVRGTIAGLQLSRPAVWRDYASWTHTRTVTTTGRGPAVLLPVLPPVGTDGDGWLSVVHVGATWVRSPGDGVVERGGMESSDGGPDAPPNRTWAGWDALRYRCDPGESPVMPPAPPAPGTCEELDRQESFLNPSRYTFDTVRGIARLRGEVHVYTLPDVQRTPMSAAWRGHAPVGVHRVESQLSEPGQPRFTTTVSGIRWQRPTAQVTLGDERLRVVSATMFAFKERLVTTGP